VNIICGKTKFSKIGNQVIRFAIRRSP